MPSPAPALSDFPTRFNRYRATARTPLNYKVWNGSVGDLALRMEAVEGKATGYDALVSAGIGVALDRIDEALLPAFTRVSAVIDQTNAYLLQLEGNRIVASLVETNPAMRFVTDAQLSQIDGIADLAASVGRLALNAAQRGRGFYLATM